jgi:hypothetical protein
LNRGRLLFEIEGVPRRRFMKKLRSYAALYEDAVEIELDGVRDLYTRHDVSDIFVKEPLVEGIDSRTVVVEFAEEGEQNWYELEESTFPEIASKIEMALEREWAFIADRRNYPDAVRWLTACCAVVSISGEENPFIFGGTYREPENAAAQREVLYDSWGFNNRQELLAMLPLLLDGRAVKQYREAGMRQAAIKREGGERCLWAWDLQRCILLGARLCVRLAVVGGGRRLGFAGRTTVAGDLRQLGRVHALLPARLLFLVGRSP